MRASKSKASQPSLAPSSSSSSLASSSPAPTPPASPSTPTMKMTTVHENKTNNSWSMQKLLIAILSGVGLLSVSIFVLPDELLSSISTPSLMTKACSNDTGSCPAEESEDVTITTTTTSRHRGKIIGARVKSADLEAAYQSIKTEYANLALHPSTSTQWQVLSSHSDGSEVALLEHPTDPSCPYVRMTSVMPGTIQDVWDFLDLKNWATTMPKMDPFYEGLSVLGTYKHKGLDMKLGRKTIKRIGIFGKRDFTFVSVSDHPRGDGAWVSGTVSVVTDQIPRKKGYVRAYQDSIAFYESMPNNNKEKTSGGPPQMKLTIVFRIDLNDTRSGGEGGFVPMWIYVKTVGATGMTSVQNMKRELMLLAKQREKKAKMKNNKNMSVDSEICEKSNWLKKITNKC